ncbi:hypothetical protein ACOJUR_15380 [Alicyclobacillus tolerans]|uniref:hypothetical protein n=1 Tax=Alicyclobacillus tolerans TaxID=90970 RepID=UPI003B7EAABD
MDRIEWTLELTQLSLWEDSEENRCRHLARKLYRFKTQLPWCAWETLEEAWDSTILRSWCNQPLIVGHELEHAATLAEATIPFVSNSTMLRLDIGRARQHLMSDPTPLSKRQVELWHEALEHLHRCELAQWEQAYLKMVDLIENRNDEWTAAENFYTSALVSAMIGSAHSDAIG